MPSPTESTPAVNTNLSELQTIDSLIYSHKWFIDDLQDTYDLSYSFINKNSVFDDFNYDSETNSNILWSSLDEFNLVQKTALRNVISEWSQVSGITFIEVEESETTVGDIRLGLSSEVQSLVGDATGFAYLPGNFYPSSGDIWFNSNANDLFGGFVTSTFENSEFKPGSLAYYTALHEFGHALGLKHPFETLPEAKSVLSSNLDEISNTIMSYTYVANDSSVLGLNIYPSTPMSYDISAIQHLYGKNVSFGIEDTTYYFGDGQFYFETIWDPNGVDTISYDGNYSLNINLIPGSGSFVGKEVETYGNNSSYSEYAIPNIWLSNNTEIENVIGSRGNDVIRGNYLNNEISGGLGNDFIFGEDGNDVIKGGPGSDNVEGGAGFDVYKLTYAYDNYSLNQVSDETWLIDGNPGEGDDLITGIERLSFGDVTFGDSMIQIVALDTGPGETAGQAYRLYQAAFARMPDGQGVSYHVNDIEKNGLNLYQVAQNFLASPEFLDKYGSNLSDIDYVNALYQNVLGRSGSETEVKFYIDNFEKEKTEAGYMDRGMALIGFSESPENISLVASQIDNGILFF
ncbi:MAG: hypothetical protein CBC60_06990 [Betaproteobacteria bacterium TMED100]|nr:MAG: hypothetical protein CBC01_00615 [Betaproteobacteria bacterium TMED41]OUV28342.1 MAG: hypothetical protein CBC60_06990 [Betaproteobacteria bacterium TMED100]